jgi:hypothetical protein
LKDRNVTEVGVFWATIHQPRHHFSVVHQSKGVSGRKVTRRSARFLVQDFVKL